ncbi:MAG: lipid-A-disaccharide synthase [Verrucomicrobiota bacterium]|jgi:lipid-A-disaccharide synthase
MNRPAIMLVAGDPSGDANAAALVRQLAAAVPAAQFQMTHDPQPLTTPLAPAFFGAGGPKMAAAGVELAGDLTAHAVIGLGGLFNKLPMLRRRMAEMVRLAIARQPELIILVDYGGFNLRFARAIKKYVRARTGGFFNWQPKIVGFISPQVWASRPGRAKTMARYYDLVLSLFPFEKQWFASRAPRLPVEFVGHPIFDRYPLPRRTEMPAAQDSQRPCVLLLPGSRRGELQRHLPVLLQAAGLIAARQPTRFKMVVPDQTLAGMARPLLPAGQPEIVLQAGGLADALSSSAIAITKTGTITLECAYFGLPAVAIYKTDWLTYFGGRRLVNVKYLSMPNLLAGQVIYPEFIQGQATAANIADAALQLLRSPELRLRVRAKLDLVIRSLGGPGAARRAAAAIVKLLASPRIPP